MSNPNTSEKSTDLDRQENLTKGNVSVKKVALYSYDSGTDTINPVKANSNGALTTEATISNAITLSTDNATGDAFSRLRVSTPELVFDTNFQYDLQPLLFEQIKTGSGATITHDTTNRNALFTFSSSPNGAYTIMQTYENFRYQSGRSQLALVTFNFMGGVANTLKYVGYSDGVNGIQLEMNGTTAQIKLYSGTSKGDETVTQANWNIDKMDGTGVSGLTVNWSKTQIFVVDFQWLGVGRVRCGLDINGNIYYFHEFKHANLQEVAYMQTANLPIRAGMRASATVNATMRFICCSVTSEGGQGDVAGFTFADEIVGTGAQNVDSHIGSWQPTANFNSITNRAKFMLDSIELLNVGNNPVIWKLVIGQAITGTTTFAPVNTTYSAMEKNTAGTISGNPAIIIGEGYLFANASNKGIFTKSIGTKYPITLDAGGSPRLNGRISLIAQTVGVATTNAVRCTLTWREIR